MRNSVFEWRKWCIDLTLFFVYNSVVEKRTAQTKRVRAGESSSEPGMVEARCEYTVPKITSELRS